MTLDREKVITKGIYGWIASHATEKPEPQGEEWLTEEEYIDAIGSLSGFRDVRDLLTRKLADEWVRKSEVAKAVNRLCERNTARVLLLNIGITTDASPPADG